MELPEEIVADILSRLPVKSLLRFMCVRKSWQANLIKNPQFVTLHFKQSTKNNSYLAILRRHLIMPTCYISLMCPVTYKVLHNVNVPIFEHSMEPAFRIVGSCRGLLCFSAFHSGSTFYLLNPATEEVKRLPKLSPMERPGLGFGFDAKTEDYKVVRVFYSHDGDNNKTYSKANIYSVSSESWRKSESTVDGVIYKDHTRTAEIHGALHFKAIRLIERGQKLRFIMSFDLETETFRDIMLPDEFLASENERSWQLSVLNECLSLVVHHQNGQDGTSMHIWVMKEYGVTNSWTKLYVFTRRLHIELAGFGKIGHEFVFAFEVFRRRLFGFDPCTGQAKVFKIRELEVEEPVEVFHYAESLTTIKGKRESLRKECLWFFGHLLIVLLSFCALHLFYIRYYLEN